MVVPAPAPGYKRRLLKSYGAEIIYFLLRLHLYPYRVISVPALALAINCHLKLYYNSSILRNMSQWRFFSILASNGL